jgi:light-regulated signal transduction histidine kinase (bacteriophytochrome)
LFAFVVVSFFMLRFLKKILVQEEKNKQSISEAYEDKKAISEKLYESELQLKEYAVKLEKSNQELTDFANIASHDMKAPVRNILSFAQLFERRNKDKFDERDAEYFGFIKTNANQCIKLIESLLNYSKADKNIGEPSELDVFDAVVSAQNNLTAIIDERNAVIEIDDLPTIEAHPMLISQLFQNLINNGIKYNQSAQPSVHISSKMSATEGLVFAVKDNGIGIPEKHKQDVFAMFRRLHSASEYEGSGIGLAFCKRIVETYEGRMWLESEVGVGSTFFFTLPKAKVLAKKKVLEIA